MNQQALNPYFMRAEVAYRSEWADHRKSGRKDRARTRLSVRRRHQHWG